MKIGIIVDGESEYHSLPKILHRIDTEHTILDPMRADIQPLAKPGRIAAALKSRLLILARKETDRVVVLIDREGNESCPNDIAESILDALVSTCKVHDIRIPDIVIKNRCYENWLVADVANIRRMPKRFVISGTEYAKAGNGLADEVNALQILKLSAIRHSYSKVQDAVRIMQKADPHSMAMNSRSFRKFLKSLGCPHYAS